MSARSVVSSKSCQSRLCERGLVWTGIGSNHLAELLRHVTYFLQCDSEIRVCILQNCFFGGVASDLAEQSVHKQGYFINSCDYLPVLKIMLLLVSLNFSNIKLSP